MAKTNSKGFFCDFPCGMRNPNCQIFFTAGCATGGIARRPNTEYPEITIRSAAEVEQEKEASTQKS